MTVSIIECLLYARHHGKYPNCIFKRNPHNSPVPAGILIIVCFRDEKARPWRGYVKLPKFVWLRAGGPQFEFRVPGSRAFPISPQILTCPTGSVALGGEARVAAADLVDGNDPELVVDIWGQLEDG